LSKPFETGRIAADVKDIHVHPDWNTLSNSYDADIAILELVNEVQFSDYIQPICLVEPGSAAASKTLGYVIGYEGNFTSKIDDITKRVAVLIQNNRVCSSHPILDDLLSSRGICGKFASRTDVCLRDNGSGFIVVRNNRHYLRGIASASIPNDLNECDRNPHSVFTDSSKFYGWIMTGKDDQTLIGEYFKEKKRQKAIAEKTKIVGQV
jgi:hypothetical protein